MPAPQKNNARNVPRHRGSGAADWRTLTANPVDRRRRRERRVGTAFNECVSQDAISAVLEEDILARLPMVHTVDGSLRPPRQSGDIGPCETPDPIARPSGEKTARLLEVVDRFIKQGASVEDVYLDLLAPAAGRLGEMWKDDACDFVDVTMGLWRLQEVMREVSRRSPPQVTVSRPAPSALFCPIPGDVHSFGAQMIDEVFARAGWQSDVLLRPERRELLDYVARRPVDLVGLTVTRDCPACALASLIKAIRSAAVNPNLSVLVGGHMINENPGLVAQSGADGTAVDARSALKVANDIVAAAHPRIRARAFA